MIDFSAIKISAILGAFAKLFSVLSKFLLASLFGPAGFAILTQASTLLRWMSLFNFSVLSIFLREITKLHHNEKGHEAAMLGERVTGLYLLLSVMAFVMVMSLFAFLGGLTSELFYFVLVIKLSSIFLSLTQAHLKGLGKFRELAKLTGALGVLLPVSTVVGVYFLGVQGYFISVFVLEIFITSFFLKFINLKAVLPNFSETTIFLKSSFNTYVINLMDVLMMTSYVIYFSSHNDLLQLGIIGFYLSLVSGKAIPFMNVLSPMVKRQLTPIIGRKDELTNFYNNFVFKIEIFMTTFLCAISISVLAIVTMFLEQYKIDDKTALLLVFAVSSIVNRYWYQQYAHLTKTGWKIIAVQLTVNIALLVLIIQGHEYFLRDYFILLTLNYFLNKILVLREFVNISQFVTVILRDMVGLLLNIMITFTYLLYSNQTFGLQTFLYITASLACYVMVGQLLAYISPVKFNFIGSAFQIILNRNSK